MVRCIFLLLAFLPSAYSYAYVNPIVECVDIAEDTGTTFEVCGIYEGFGPSPAMLENGTTVYLGGYGTNYTIIQGLEAGTDTTAVNVPAEAYTGIGIYVYRDDNDACNVTVTLRGSGQEDCQACSYCGNETYSADCTNLENGRDVNCESTTSIFFPLTAAALEVVTASNQTTNSSSEPPSLSPKEEAAPSDQTPPTAPTGTSSAVKISDGLIFLIGCTASLFVSLKC